MNINLNELFKQIGKKETYKQDLIYLSNYTNNNSNLLKETHTENEKE